MTHQFTVLVVDDNTVLLTVMEHLFKHKGYDVVASRHGSEALDLVRQHGAAVLVLDLELGADSGLAIVEEARRMPTTAALPIIVYSGNPFVFDPAAARLRALGCTLVDKPFRLEAMVQRVEEALAA